MGKKILNILIGLSLVPFCLGFTWQLAGTIFFITYKRDVPYYFFAGALTYLAVHVLFKKPILTYVVGHELTHALFAVLFGGSVKSFQASERGGRVAITKSNFIITLAPYFFPLYTFFTLVLYWVSHAAGVRGADGWLIFLAGATFSFHLVLTFMFLHTDQNDIKEHGALFSYPLIYLFNVIFSALLLYLLLTQDMSFLNFIFGGIMKSINMVSVTAVNVYGLIRGR